MNKPKPIGEERIAYQGKIIEVVEQDMKIGEKLITFEKARRSPGTRLIIVTPDNKIKITKEYRSDLGDYDYRLPGGKVFDTLGEFNSAIKNNEDINQKAKEAVIKEAKEEVAIRPTKIELLGVSKDGATVEWDLYYFLVTEYEDLDNQTLEDGEIIEIQEFNFQEALDLCVGGKLKEDRSISRLIQFLGAKK